MHSSFFLSLSLLRVEIQLFLVSPNRGTDWVGRNDRRWSVDFSVLSFSISVFRSIACDGVLSPKDDFFPPCLVVE